VKQGLIVLSCALEHYVIDAVIEQCHYKTSLACMRARCVHFKHGLSCFNCK